MNCVPVFVKYLLNKNELFFFQTSMAISLIKSYDLFSQLILIHAKKATREELTAFHSNEYLDYCEKSGTTEDLEKLEIHTNDRFGIGN